MELSDLHNHEDDGERRDTCPGCALLDVEDSDSAAGRPAADQKEEGPSMAERLIDAVAGPLYPTPPDISTAGRPAAMEPEEPAAGRPAAEETKGGLPVAVGQTGMIPLDAILADPEDNHARGCRSIKKTDPKLKELVETMREDGQQEPVCVRLLKPARGEKKYRLVFGFRRLAASQVLGWETIKASVVDVDDAKAAMMNWAEGCREGATRYDVAVGLTLAKKNGWPIKTITKRIGSGRTIKADDAEDLIRIMERCPKSLLDIFRSDGSDRTVSVLNRISKMEDVGSEQETHRAMVDAWEEAWAEEAAALAPKKAKPKKRRQIMPPQPKISLSQLTSLEAEIEQGSEWYDPNDRVYRTFTEETKRLARAMCRAFRKKPIQIR